MKWLECRSSDGRPIPLQVDGDYIGDIRRGDVRRSLRCALLVVGLAAASA